MEKNVQTNEKHKIKLSSEATYVAAIILLSFAVAMLSAADFGISMIVAPAYLLSLKTGVLTGHGVHHQQDLVGMDGCLHPLQLVHEGFVHMEPAGGI